MSALMTADPSLTLQDAYDQALWTRPDLREQLTKAQQEQQARAAAEQRRQSVQKAKAAQTPRTASQPQPPPDLGDLPLRELVERNVRAAFSG